MQTDSFRITFRTSGGDRAGAVDGVNNRLRGLGVPPSTAGAQPLVDRAKYLGASMDIRARRQLGRS